MSDTVIRVENLGKKYSIGHQKRESYTTLRDVLAEGTKSLGRQLLMPFGKKMPNPTVEEFWALKDVSFEIKRGDRVGIIGRNGAGKSTLLKILSRITEPTTGRIAIKGRVASLLEVGTGFHPELTGRENIYLNGAVLGMSKVEINKKFDEIVAFAEVEKFLDTPVKRYSSGMYVRLAFAVAAHLEPEILIVDEVLAVGDAAFQKKCLGKMEEVAEKEGRTVLFVSHNIGAIESLCQNGILLSQGCVSFLGSAQDAISKYASKNRTLSTGFVDLSERRVERYGSQEYAHIKNISLLDGDGSPVATLHMGQPACFRLEVEFKHPGDNFEIGIAIGNFYNVFIHYLVSNWEETLVISKKGIKIIEAKVPCIQLFPGEYVVNIWVKHQGKAYDDAIHEALRFNVEEAQITKKYAYFQRYSRNTQVYTPSLWSLLN